MEEPSYSHHGDQGYPTEQRESHWLPALRPDSEADVVHEASTVERTAPLDYTQDLSPEPVGVPVLEKSTLQQRENNLYNELDNDNGDEPLDPAWGFGRTESADILNSARRSSSFPRYTDPEASVEAIEQSKDEEFQQEEEIDFNGLINGVHQTTELSHDTFDNTTSVETFEASHPDKSPPIGQTQNDFLDNRFEEGVPLISPVQPTQEDVQPLLEEPVQTTTFEDLAGEDEEASFFTQIQHESTSGRGIPVLERKSTEEVLDSLHVMDSQDTRDSPEGLGLRAEDFAGSVDFSSLLDTGLASDGADNTKETDNIWAAVLDDDEFLVEDADDLLPDSDSDPGSPSSFLATLKQQNNLPQADVNRLPDASDAQQSRLGTQQAVNSYAPHQPSTSNMTQLSPKAHGNVGFTRPGLGPMGSFQNHVQQPTIVTRAESFADQSKGGYKSPYDLPMDLKPKKRPQPQRISSQPQGLPPPPRTSSMSSQKQLQSPFTPTNATFGQIGGPSITSPPVSSRNISAPGSMAAVPARQPSSSSFFEELPVTSKARAPSNTGRYTPSQNVTASPPRLQHASPPRQRQLSNQSAPSPPHVADSYAQYQLRAPDRLDPYNSVATQPSSLPAPIVPTSRYSPAPGTFPGQPRPTPSPRYSPAPPSQPPAGPGRYASQPTSGPTAPMAPPASNRYASQTVQAPPASTSLPFLPRTSSPLAYQGKPLTEQTGNLMPPPPLPKSNQVPQTAMDMQQPPMFGIPPASSTQPNDPTFSPPKNAYAPGQPVLPPPRRSQTQSPSRQMARTSRQSVLKNTSRPASSYGEVPISKAPSQPEQSPTTVPVSRPKVPAPEMDFEQPQDETQYDQLTRWKGAPIFKFGFGGVIVSSFPKHTPRYKAGQIKPQIKSTAGEVRTRVVKDLSLLPEHVTSFPGPLKGKSKKKDVLNWMSSAIAKFENEAPVILGAAQTLPDPRTCHEEMVLLWKIVRIFVEHDGIIENKPEALKAVNTVLSPEVHAIDESTASQYKDDTELNGIYRPAGANVRAEAADPMAVESLRKHLLKGEREQAVWKAVDSRLWSHAFLIASTIRDNQKTWKQVVQEFVRQEVKSIGNNSEGLSALYEIFGGNMEESIDQLVPPSARAGLQMVSKADTVGPTKNALDGLNRWKETLTLVLNNRTPDDQRALATLGALLASYGRVQAAHICFLFARNPLSPNVFGGVEDTQASITLLGSDQRTLPLSFHQDYNALLLTEVYEFAISTLAPTAMAMPLPHLSAYKLQRALDLADNGYKTEAQAYCDAIASGITSKSKVSPFYHPSLLMEVDELAKRLKQVPVQSSSWIAKPSLERTTNSLLSKLSNFVAGDDSDAESKASADNVGPFAKASGSPNLSRSASQTDLYSSYPGVPQTMPMTAASSRYAPGGISSTRSSSDLTRGRPSLDSQRSPPTTSHGYEPRQSMYAPSSATNQFNQSPARSVSSYQPYGTSPSRSNYQATPPQPSYMPEAAASQSMISDESKMDSYAPVPSAPAEELAPYSSSQPDPIQQPSEQPMFGGYMPSMPSMQEHADSRPEMPTASSYDQPQSYGYGYEPPADTGYVPYEPEPDSDDEKKKTKPKKSFRDNDEDTYTPMPSKPTTSTKASTSDDGARKKANDEAADAAFRAAAEADAQRAKEQKKGASGGGGWLGGWFGGKKADASLDAAAPKSSGADQKVFKAKLGEDKMKLYYDKDLKKWVNPDDPDASKAKTATPPPPPGRSPAPPPSAGPPRMGGTPLPPLPVSRSSTPASTAAGDSSGLGIAATLPPSVNAGLGLGSNSGSPPSSSEGAPPPAGGLALPSRPLSNASSIDDLIGPATARKGAKGRGAKKGRYVDVMAQ